MISKRIVESLLNITSISNNFKSFIKQYIKNNRPKVLKRIRFKIITPEEWNFDDSENLIFIKVNLPTHICPTRNWQSF